ncbi:MAG TPA: endopeptidase La [Candidatus Binatia bacterium]|jgi:ATP-dependent Lon protease|nr:endopeptidase La [Candidatus Binatia bacterium]
MTTDSQKEAGGENPFLTAESSQSVADAEIPAQLPILPMRDVALFPGISGPLAVGREASVRLIEDAFAGDMLIGLVAQRTPSEDKPQPAGLYTVGVAARLHRAQQLPNGTLQVLVQGLQRIKVLEYLQEEPYFRARVQLVEDEVETSKEMENLQVYLVQQFGKLVTHTPLISGELLAALANISSPGMISDIIAGHLNIPLAEKQELLETLAVKVRLAKLSTIVTRELEVIELGQKIQSEVQTEMAKGQREFILRQQMKAIQRELGEEGEEAVLRELEERITAAQMPPDVEKVAKHELERLRTIPPASPERTVALTYLDWLTNLPWAITTEDTLDTVHAQAVLDEDHFDLERVKERILEFLAVRQLRPESKGPILCLVGPPGTGKTSLGRSIARALGRKFVRISLGGVRDEAEIRGHRRTYVGALPGRIIQALRQAKSRNPVFILDEIDKLGMDFRGDPSAALLEVLDPEQNATFVDHYLDVPFDLSAVMFITTANFLDPIPPALRDRMEVLELPGYTDEEKVAIAQRYLIPKQLQENGLQAEQLSFTPEAIRTVITGYTREAGLRNLERTLARVCRKVARGRTEGRKETVEVTPKNLADFLGPRQFFAEVAERAGIPGVATGLAWTPTGGEILFVEATRMRGKGGLTLTGHLGEVMKESAQAALSYVRSNALALGIAEDLFERTDIHIHVPAGAIAKDGPSAGVAMVVALTSLLTNTRTKPVTAMTGEITLRGKVLPVGGIKEKVLAAGRAGITTVILPHHNEKDLADVPQEIREKIAFVFVEEIREAIAAALAGEGGRQPFAVQGSPEEMRI